METLAKMVPRVFKTTVVVFIDAVVAQTLLVQHVKHPWLVFCKQCKYVTNHQHFNVIISMSINILNIYVPSKFDCDSNSSQSVSSCYSQTCTYLSRKIHGAT